MSNALIFEKGRPGRRGSTLPRLDVPEASGVTADLERGEAAGLPEVSELDVVRHYVNLSRKNMGIDTNFYPLGSCTMKYNPKLHERIAAMPAFSFSMRSGSMVRVPVLLILFNASLIQWWAVPTPRP